MGFVDPIWMLLEGGMGVVDASIVCIEDFLWSEVTTKIVSNGAKSPMDQIVTQAFGE